MATEIEIDTVINTDRSEQSLRQLNKGLKDLISLQSQIADKGSDQFKKLQKAINETEGKIGDLNDSFQTLRGSGVERLNGSLGLLKEGFLSADPGKISTGFKGLGAAMSAVPIFLLIEGLTYLVQNFEEVVNVVKNVIGVVDEQAEAQKRLNKELQETSFTLNELGLSYKYFESQRKQGLAIEIEQLNKRGAKQIEIDNLIIESEQKKLDKLKKIRDEATVLGVQDLTKYQNAVFEQEDQIAVLNAKNATERVKLAQEAYEKQKAIGAANAAEFNRLLGLQQEYEEAVNAARIADAQAASDKEVAIIKKQIEDENAFRSYLRTQNSEQEREIADSLESERRLRSENRLAYDAAFQQVNLEQKISFIEQERDLALTNEQLTQQQRIEVIEKAENDIFNLKVKKANDYATIAEQGIMGVQAIADIAFEIQSARLEKGSKEEDEAARKRFNVNKGLQIANAAIQGAQAVLAAFSSGAAIPIAGVIAGPAFAAVAGAVALANIAKIANTQYKSSASTSPSSSSGGVGTIPNIPTSLSPSQSPSFAPSTFNPSGQANAQTSTEVTEPVKVYVLESDIRNVTNKVNVIESRATFP